MIKNYITVAKGINPPYKWFILDDEIDSNDFSFVTKKILTKHKEILDAYLKDSDSHISWKISDDSEIWHCRKPFIEEYKESYIYRIIKEDKNNFKEYGFEADFEGEICFESQSYYVGYVIDEGKKLPRYWTKDLICFNPLATKWENAKLFHSDHQYNLKPIKKVWYENPDNFPCVVTEDDLNLLICSNKYEWIDLDKHHSGNFRPATKEEVLSLLVKEE